MKKFLSLFLVVSSISIEIVASKSGSQNSKMDTENYVLVHNFEEILPSPERANWKKIAKKAFRQKRHQELNTLKARLVKERAKTFKLEGVLDGMAQSSRSIIGVLRSECAVRDENARLMRIKHNAFKTTSRNLYFALQRNHEQLTAEYKAALERDELAAGQFQADLKELHARNVDLTKQVQLQEQAVQRFQTDNQCLQVQVQMSQAKIAQEAVLKQQLLADLESQLRAAQGAHALASTQYQATLQELNTAQADKRSAQQQLNQEQSARTVTEQALRGQLTTAQQAHAAATQNYQTTLAELNTARANIQTVQSQLQQVQVANAISEQQLRTQLTTTQAANNTAAQNHQVALAARAAAEQALAQQLAQSQTSYRQVCTYSNNLDARYATAVNDLNAARANVQKLQSDLQLAQAAKATSEQQLQAKLTSETQRYEAALTVMHCIEKNLRVQEGQLRGQVAAAQAESATAKQGQQAAVAQLNVLKAKWDKFKATFLQHHDAYYCSHANPGLLAIAQALQRIVLAQPVNEKVLRRNMLDAKNLGVCFTNLGM